MVSILATLSSPNSSSRNSWEPRLFTLPCILRHRCFLHPPVFSPLFASMHTHYSVSVVPTARRGSASRVIYLVPLVVFVYLSMIKRRRTEKSIAVPHSLSALLSNGNPSQPSRPDSKPSQSNIRFVKAPEDPMPLSQ